MKHRGRWHPDSQGWRKADWCREALFMQPLQLSDFLSEHCGSSCATSFQSVEISGVESAPLGRVWVFYRVARPGFWPDYTSTITSVWYPSLYLPLLWLRHSRTIPRPGSTFGKLLEQSSPISLQSQTHFNHTEGPNRRCPTRQEF